MLVPADHLTGGPRLARFSEHYVRHTKGRWAGHPLVYESWQRDFLWEMLEIDPSTGLRVYSEVGLILPRKNGKSMLATATGLYMLLADGEAEPEVYVGAAAKNQAGLVLGQARSCCHRSTRLLDHVRVLRYAIEAPRTGGIMRSLSSEGGLQHGLNPSCNVVDELHAHKNGDLYVALTTGTGAREQPLTLWITTPGVAGEGILAEVAHPLLYGGAGTLEDRGALRIYRDRAAGVLIYHYGAPLDADIHDPAVWLACNPASWLQDGKYLRQQYLRLTSRGQVNEWKRYHLAQFVGEDETWLPEGAWARCAGTVTLRADLPVGVGVQVTPDRSAAAVVVAQRQGDRVVVQHTPYHAQQATGRVAVGAIRDHLRTLRRLYPKAAVRDAKTHRPILGPAFGYDPWQFRESADVLDTEGLNMVEVPHTAAHMGPASGLVYELVTTGRLVHDGDPVLAQHVRSTTARETERGLMATANLGVRHNHAALAVVRAAAMATAEAPRAVHQQQVRAAGAAGF